MKMEEQKKEEKKKEGFLDKAGKFIEKNPRTTKAIALATVFLTGVGIGKARSNKRIKRLKEETSQLRSSINEYRDANDSLCEANDRLFASAMKQAGINENLNYENQGYKRDSANNSYQMGKLTAENERLQREVSYLRNKQSN